MANAVNDIAYWKQEYDKAKSSGKGKSSLDWISNQAQKSYSQLDTTTANTLKGMNAQQAFDYSKSQTASTPANTSAVSAQAEPFTMETFANMLTSLTQNQNPNRGTDFSQLNFAGDAATQKNMLEMMQEIYASELPYQQATVKDQMANRLASQEQMGYDANGAMTLNMAKLMGYDNYGNLTLDGSVAQDKSKQAWYTAQDQSSQDWTKIFGQDGNGNQTLDAQTSWAKILGYDSSGNQTLDARVASDKSANQWAETYGFDADGNLTVSGIKANNDTLRANSDRWYKEEQASQGWANVDIRQQVADNNFEIDVENVRINQGRLDETIANNAAKLTNSSVRNGFLDQTKQIKVLMDSSAAEMKRAQAILKDFKQTTPEGQQAFADFQKAKMQYETAYASIDALAQSGIVEGANGPKASAAPRNANNFGTGMGKMLESLATSKATEMKLVKTSGLRTPEKNKEIGGSKTSDHLTGRAADYAGTPQQMEAYAQWAAKSGQYTKVIYGGRNLITGKKDTGHDDHVHLSW